MTRQLEHLLELARHGQHPGASDTERQARQLVKCLLENAIGLDGAATAGIQELAELVQDHPQEGSAAVRLWIA